MTRPYKKTFFAAFLVLLATPATALAQTKQIWPEVSAYVRLTDNSRLFFLVETIQEHEQSTEVEFGPSLDFYFNRIKKLDPWHLVRADESKNRFVLIRFGYHYVHSLDSDAADENRGVIEVTPRARLRGGLLLSDRNRMDLRFIGGEYSWRYRNRLTLDREFEVGRLKMGPYARAEAFYDSRHGTVSRTTVSAGSTFFLGKRAELEGYLLHQLDTGGSANRQTNVVGIVLSARFQGGAKAK